MPRILIVSGEGPDTDPWHHLPSTSAALAAALESLAPVRIAGSRSIFAADLDGVRLVVANVSGEGVPDPASQTVALIESANRGGAAVLGIHSSVLGFPGDERWMDLLGGRWERGTTFHPQIGNALIQSDAAHPLAAADFLVYDERYSAIAVRDGNRRLAFHTEDGVVHDLAWTRERDGRGRSAYWGLGHGTESLDSAEHRERLLAVARWLLAEPRDGEAW